LRERAAISGDEYAKMLEELKALKDARAKDAGKIYFTHASNALLVKSRCVGIAGRSMGRIGTAGKMWFYSI